MEIYHFTRNSVIVKWLSYFKQGDFCKPLIDFQIPNYCTYRITMIAIHVELKIATTIKVWTTELRHSKVL